jgi:hypothetical protein
MKQGQSRDKTITRQEKTEEKRRQEKKRQKTTHKNHTTRKSHQGETRHTIILDLLRIAFGIETQRHNTTQRDQKRRQQMKKKTEDLPNVLIKFLRHFDKLFCLECCQTKNKAGVWVARRIGETRQSI